LKNRMQAIAPNLTVLVGEIVGARLIAKAGNLMNLAKYPASTVQILGAEKALFRALKTKHETPKYGLIYHASLIGQSTPKMKGKISRMLAAKVSLAVRVDALGEDGNTTLGIDHLAKLQHNLKNLEEGATRKISGSGKAKPKFDKYENKSEVKTYNASSDSTLPKKRKQDEVAEDEPKVKKIKTEVAEPQEESTPAKSEKKKKKKLKSSDDTPVTPSADATPTTPASEQRKKKKRKAADDETSMPSAEQSTPDVSSEKKKKKKE